MSLISALVKYGIAAALFVLVVAGAYWSAYVIFVPAPVRESNRTLGDGANSRTAALQLVINQNIRPGQRLREAENWLGQSGFKDHCVDHPCGPADHLFEYNAPAIFWPLLRSNSWSVRVYADESDKVTEALSNVSVTAGLW